ncbi:MAG TPA: VOC family protein [Acidimicrobiales bacterium]|nr:VOC family protein [Acidimicrobiales bacterium]
MALYPYLNFGGTCREAFTRYQEILGGELEVLTFAELPDGEQMPGVAPDMVMHAALRFGDDLLMASDDPGFDGVRGIAVNLTLTDPDEARRVFAALAEGGEVTMPLAETFWSPVFGMCTDRFGIPWMINVEPGDE